MSNDKTYTTHAWAEEPVLYPVANISTKNHTQLTFDSAILNASRVNVTVDLNTSTANTTINNFNTSNNNWNFTQWMQNVTEGNITVLNIT